MKIFKISILSCTDNRVYTRWIIKRAAIHRELLKGRWARLGLRTTRRSKGNESMGTRGRSNERGGSRSYPRWKLGRPSGERRWGDRLVDRQETISRYRSIDIGRFLSLSLSVFCVVVSSTRFFIFVKRGSNDSSYSYPRAINSVGKWMVVGNSRVFFFFSFFVVGYWSRIPGGGVVKRYKLAVFSARYQWNSILLPCVFSIRTNSFSRSLII